MPRLDDQRNGDGRRLDPVAAEMTRLDDVPAMLMGDVDVDHLPILAGFNRHVAKATDPVSGLERRFALGRAVAFAVVVKRKGEGHERGSG